MANIPIPYSFVAGTLIDPDQVNANFQSLSLGAVSEAGGDLNSPHISGTLQVDGSLVVNGPATVTGLATLSGGVATPTLTVSGQTTLTNVLVNGTLGVVGHTTLTSMLVNQNASVTGSMTVSGLTTLTSVVMSGNVQIATLTAGATNLGSLVVGGIIASTRAPSSAPFTLPGWKLYDDGSNWAHIVYGNDANLRIVFSKTATGQNLIFGTSSANDGTGTFFAVTSISAAGAFNTIGALTAPTGAFSGGVTVGGTLVVSSAASVGGDFLVSGGLSVVGSAGVSGLATVGAIQVSGAANVGTTLIVGGATTLASLTVNGNTGLNTATANGLSCNSFAANGATITTLTVTGNATVNGILSYALVGVFNHHPLLINTTYSAKCDGIVVAYGTIPPDTSSSLYIYSRVDASFGSADVKCISNVRSLPAWPMSHNVFSPIRKGDFFRVEGVGFTEALVWWTPMGTGGF